MQPGDRLHELELLRPRGAPRGDDRFEGARRLRVIARGRGNAAARALDDVVLVGRLAGNRVRLVDLLECIPVLPRLVERFGGLEGLADLGADGVRVGGSGRGGNGSGQEKGAGECARAKHVEADHRAFSRILNGRGRARGRGPGHAGFSR